jgi:ribonuclease Z
MLDVALVGSGGTVPLPGRWLSALLVRLGPDLLLFDCGEGTQISMRQLGWGFKALATICLSHRHADHVAGLPGLLLAVANAGRAEPLTVYGPPGTAATVAALRSVAPYLPFAVQVGELRGGDAAPLGSASLACLELDHGVPCLGYRLDVPRGPRFDPERARGLGVPLPLWKRLQQGEPVVWDTGRAEPTEVLGPARRGLRIAYVTDTRPTAELPAFVAGADLLVCEGTYGDPADADNALANRHMLFSEAAEIARAAGAARLWLTHFSAKLTEPGRFLPHATAVFPETVIGHDHLSTTLAFDERR